MSKTQRVVRGMSVVGLAASAVWLPVAANAADEPQPVPKAQVEYLERQGAPHPPKAQIEHAERGAEPANKPGSATSISDSSTGNAVAWQLALSAAAGAAVTGVVLVGTQRVRRHHSVVA
ncbi:MAG TPA: hypothetical protein VFD41_10000 [Actinomycetales bacterium]|nr:hypothetical protein [Actinomycetales bacterium]